MPRLYIIPGHGNGDPGAGGGGENEAERVRALATRIKQLAADPSDVTLHDFSRNAYAQKDLNTLNVPAGTMVLELHRDAANGSARGAHVVIKGGYKADAFDTALAQKLASIFPGRSSIIVGRDNLANVNRAAARGINYRLAEVGFIDNAEDRRIFNTRMDEIARAILSAAGIAAKGATAPAHRVKAKGWYKDSGGWWYENGDGTYKNSTWWNPSRGVWYYFNSKGYALNGWNQVGGKWYYFARAGESGLKECQMVAGAWRKDKAGKDYWLSGDGSMATARWVDKARYYVDAHGVWDKAR